MCCPPRTLEGNGPSAQDVPCVRRCRNRTVPALIRLPPSGDTIGSRFYRTKRLLQSSFRSHSAARHCWVAAEHGRSVRTAAASGCWMCRYPVPGQWQSTSCSAPKGSSKKPWVSTPHMSPAEAGHVWKGGARERTMFSPTGGNGGKRTLRRRKAARRAPGCR